jgi:hypothetical protein
MPLTGGSCSTRAYSRGAADDGAARFQPPDPEGAEDVHAAQRAGHHGGEVLWISAVLRDAFCVPSRQHGSASLFEDCGSALPATRSIPLAANVTPRAVGSATPWQRALD